MDTPEAEAFGYRPEVDGVNLCRPFPDGAVRSRAGGGRDGNVNYYSYDTILARVIAETSNRFNFRVVDQRYDGDRAYILGQLTIPGLGTREHWGVVTTESNGKAASEDMAAKGATTDAFKKCAEMFGVGLELKAKNGVFDFPSPIHPQMEKEDFEAIIEAIGFLYPDTTDAARRKILASYIVDRYGRGRMSPHPFSLNHPEAEDVRDHFRALAGDAETDALRAEIIRLEKALDAKVAPSANGKEAQPALIPGGESTTSPKSADKAK